MKKNNIDASSGVVLKLLSLPREVVEKLKLVAEKDRRKIKPFMEKILIDYAESLK